MIIGDLHFSPATLQLATDALYMAIAKAKELKVPLVVNGDSLDTKAIMRGEVVNRLIEIFNRNIGIPAYVNVGNHCLINEKSQEHTLHFLKPYVTVIDFAQYVPELEAYVIPYQTSKDALQSILSGIPGGSTIYMHQGVSGAYLGHYSQDRTSLPPDAFKHFRVISGHYHRAQDIDTGGGVFSYVGNPYTQNFGEASDPAKGFAVLYQDGSLERIPTNLRKHVVMDLKYENWGNAWSNGYQDGDLAWIKISGTRSQLDSLEKETVGRFKLGHCNFKFDRIYTDQPTLPAQVAEVSEADMLDSLIDASGETGEQCERLKRLWREIV